VKVINKDGSFVTTKVVVKQLCYMHVTPMLKRLYLSKEIVKQMRWYKEEKHDSEDPDIMSHPADSPRSVHLGLSTDDFQPHSEASSPCSC
jgi:hypothetical protein